MAKDEQSLMDWLVEDICNTIELKGAVEATRDENGKVDKWAATGLAMGLGHTSDDEMATLAGILGAEGAFDDDDDSLDDDIGDIDYDDDVPISTVTPALVKYTPAPANEAEYEQKKKDIISEKSFIVIACIAAICILTVVFLSAMGSYPDGAAVYFVALIVCDASLVYAIKNASDTRERELSALEARYNESVRKKKEEKKRT